MADLCGCPTVGQGLTLGAPQVRQNFRYFAGDVQDCTVSLRPANTRGGASIDRLRT